jgi:signal transduction histidine kinase/ligand-binding sensor domain-containing protein
MFQKLLPFFITALTLIASLTVSAQINIVPIGTRKVNMEEPLSQGRVLSIVEDDQGLMWIGTLDGLNSYDGYNVEVYRRILGDSTSLSNNTVNSLCIDNSSNIWIGTENGLNVLNPIDKTFKSYFENDKKYAKMNANQITKVLVGDSGYIWLATAGAGIVKFNPRNGHREYVSLDIDSSNFSNNIISNFVIGGYGDLWFANSVGKVGRINKEFNKIEYFNFVGRETEKKISYINSILINSAGKVLFSVMGRYIGLYYYDKSKNLIVEDRNFNDNLYNDTFWAHIISLGFLSEDLHGNIWIACVFKGIFKYSNDGTISYYPDYVLDEQGDEHFEAPGIRQLYFSSSNILWIGSNGYGMTSVNDFNFKFHTISKGEFAPGFRIKSVRAIYEDTSYLWIGGYYGLARINKITDEVKSFLYGISIYKIYPDRDNYNYLYIGTEGDGLYKYKKSSEHFTKDFYSPPKGVSEGLNVYELNQQGDSILWIGRDSGLEKLNLKTRSSEKIELDSIQNQFLNSGFTVLSSLIDKNNTIWIGTLKNGLWFYDKKKNALVHKNLSLTGYAVQPVRINSIMQDSKGNYWLSTGNGLYFSSDMNARFELLTVENGLPNDFVYACLEDNQNNFWISTNNGLSNYNSYNASFTNYYTNSGLKTNEFNTGAYFKSKDGTLYFGGIDGLMFFQPKYLSNDHKEYPFVITKIEVDNNLIIPKENTPGNYEIELNKNDDNLSIEFAYLSYLGEKQNEYEYRRSGNSKWIKLGSTNHIVIEKPKHGREIFEFRARTRDGQWDKKTVVLEVEKQPYPWQTWYFWLFVVAFIALLVVLYIKRRLYKIKKEKRKLETLVEERTRKLAVSNKSLVQSNATKDRLFSIIAHDLRNPLNSLLGFTSLIHAQSGLYSDDEIKQFIATIYISSKNLNNLLDNLLGWSRLQMDKIKPNFRNAAIDDIIKSNLLFLDGNIGEKCLKIYHNESPEYLVFVDIDLLSLIIRNILSNAIKFTQYGGEITISTNLVDDYICVVIKDTGMGMDKKTVDSLFSDDNNFTNVGTNNERGTGLGLILCNDFIKLLKGKIEVESTLGVGTEFLIYVPNSKHLS